MEEQGAGLPDGAAKAANGTGSGMDDRMPGPGPDPGAGHAEAEGQGLTAVGGAAREAPVEVAGERSAPGGEAIEGQAGSGTAGGSPGGAGVDDDAQQAAHAHAHGADGQGAVGDAGGVGGQGDAGRAEDETKGLGARGVASLGAAGLADVGVDVGAGSEGGPGAGGLVAGQGSVGGTDAGESDATTLDATPPAPDSATPADGAGDPPVMPMVVTPALRTVLAWSEITASEGEDDLEPFPFAGDAEAEEDEAGAEVEAEADGEQVPAAVGAGTVDATPPGWGEDVGDGMGIAGVRPVEAAVPLATLAERLPATLPSARTTAGVGGGGGGDGGAGHGASSSGGGGERRRGFIEIIDKPMTIFEHLDELRRRLLWAVFSFVAGTALTFAFIAQVLRFTERPLLAMGVQLHATAPMETLFGSVELAAVGGVLIGSPIIIYQAVMYILPALTRKERNILFSYLPATSLLFAAGLAFGYFVFEPVALAVATRYLRSIVIPIYTLTNWIHFLIEYSLPFGAIFELPVVCAVLTRLGVLTPEFLIKGRRVAIFGAVVVGEIFSPPADFIFTPSLIALPIIGLYEVSIMVSKVAYRQRLRSLDEE